MRTETGTEKDASTLKQIEPSNMLMESFKGIVPPQFVVDRDTKVLMDGNTTSKVPAWYRWDCEFPEFHQAMTTEHRLYKGYEYDTTHPTYGNVDFKYYSNAGAHISLYIQKQMREGVVNTIALWKWMRHPQVKLQEGQEVGYYIMGYFDAKLVLNNLHGDRFTIDSL